MVFYWSLSDNKSHQVSRTLLSILADLHNAVIWMVSVGSPISNSSGALIKSLKIIPSAPITIPHFFSSLARSKYIVFFDFHSVVYLDSKVHYTAGSFYLFIYLFIWYLSLGLVIFIIIIIIIILLIWEF